MSKLMSNVRRRLPRLGPLRRRRHLRRSRRLAGEPLESRLLLASDWQNEAMPMDTNRDNHVSSFDVLVVINDLNGNGSRMLPPLDSSEGEGPAPFAVDVNGDGAASPIDALLVINHLNAEGEDDAVARYSVRVFDESGENEITTVSLGDTYVVKAFIEDIRTDIPDVAETIVLRSGQDAAGPIDAPGTLDASITYAPMDPNSGPLPSLSPDDFLAAQNGSAAVAVDPNSAWIAPSSFPDTTARWINWSHSEDSAIAVDDTATVAEEGSVTIDVLQNDIPEDPRPTVDDFTEAMHGEVIQNADDTFTYIPDDGFFGEDSFTYTISSGAGMGDGSGSPPGSVLYAHPFEVTAALEDGSLAFLDFSWAVDDTLGDASQMGVFVNGVPVPITGGGPGTANSVEDLPIFVFNGTNYLYVYQQDVSSDVSGVIYSATIDLKPGVFAAYADVTYQQELTSVVPNGFIDRGQPVTILHNREDYGNGRSGDVSMAGRIDGVGSFGSNETGPGEFNLWQVKFVAQELGRVDFVVESTTDPDDPFDLGQSPTLDTGLYRQNVPVCPSVGECMGTVMYVGDTVTIVADAAPVVAEEAAMDDMETSADGASEVEESPPATGPESFAEAVAVTATVTITVTPVNDAPMLEAPESVMTNEDVELPFGSSIFVSDEDGDVTVDVMLGVQNGTLTAQSTTVTGSGTPNLSISGLVSEVNSALSTLAYLPDQDFNGADSLTILVDDNGNIGGGNLTADATVSITVDAVNDAPIIDGAVNQAPLFFDQTLTFSSAGGNAITVSDVDANQLTFELSLSRGTFTLGSTDDLQVTGDGTDSVSIIGSPAAISDGLDGSVFDPIFDPMEPFTGNVMVGVSADDGGQTGSGPPGVTTESFLIPVVPPQRPFAAPDSLETDEDVPLDFDTSTLTANDLFPENLQSFELTFDAMTTAGGQVSLDDSTFTYTPPSNFFGTDGFTYTLTTIPAGDGPSTGMVTIDVRAINDVPVLVVPDDQTIDEDDTLDFGSSISVSDADGNVDMMASLSVDHGTLSATLDGASVSGNDTDSVVLSGTVDQINAALNGLIYRPLAHFNGSDELSVTVDDLGNIGAGEGVVTETVDITVDAVNDPPTVSLPDADDLLLITNFDNELSGAAGTAIQVSDIDAGAADIEVRLQASFGTLTVTDVGSLESAVGNGTGDVLLTGSLVELNAALAIGVVYQSSVTGNVTLTVTADDLGNTGSGDATTGSASITVEVFEFIPSLFGGRVYVDADKDGNFDVGERAVEGVEIVLTGTDFRGETVNERTTTDSHGLYLFGEVRPGSYLIQQTQPANLIDGPESFHAPVESAGNDTGRMEIDIRGGEESLHNDFTETGLEPAFFDAGVDLTTAGLPGGPLYEGMLFGVDGDADWSMFLGDTWTPRYSEARFELAPDMLSGTLTVFDSQLGEDRTAVVTFESSRLRVRQDGDAMVIRIIGSPSDFFGSGTEGEGEAALDQTADQYANDVDRVMAAMV